MSQQFDHEKLEVYRASIQFVAYAYRIAEKCQGPHRFARDQLLRSSQSIPLNIAEGNGKWTPRDRGRFFEIARGSATESAANLDVVYTCGGVSQSALEEGKALLIRIVSMISKMIAPRAGSAREDEVIYRESGLTESEDTKT